MREISEKNYEALEFVIANKHFFLAPLLYQNKFLDWAQDKFDSQTLATNLSQQLQFSLIDASGQPRSGEYIQAMTGKLLEMDDRCLLTGGSESLINLLEELPNFATTLLKIKTKSNYQQLINDWNRDNIYQMVKVDARINQLVSLAVVN